MADAATARNVPRILFKHLVLVQAMGWMGSLNAALAVTSTHGQHSGKS